MSNTKCSLPTRAELRRCNIKEVARRLFVENGFHATGIAAIAKESGVAVQQLYRDFPSKEDIIAAIVAADCERIADQNTLNAALSTKDREGIIAWLVGNPCRKDDASDRLFLEIAAEAARNDRIRAIFLDVRERAFENISRAFAGLMGSDSINDEHRKLAQAFMIISLGSVCARTLHQENVKPGSDTLIACLIDCARP
ncbi:TetR/AcrR family transcriptional regulator [Sphingomonas sp. PB1R3]|uniref:TetR/AcrR family transcriptional regulator n=1 Tax=Sphingomonas flavida TaxID=3096154 RepID=UPI002FC8D467